jgi:3-oxoacyl-[acyl-carrier protein] reductase
VNLELAGKRAIVCGSSQGLGLACAVALAEAGAVVILNGRSEARLARTCTQLEAKFQRHFDAVVADVTTKDGRAALLAALPDPDILVNNSAGPSPGDFEHWGETEWSNAVSSCMLAPIYMITAVIKSMRQRRWGRIINITSVAVKEPVPLLGLSTASRLGLTGFVASITREVAADGVTVNNLLPGPFATDRMSTYVASLAKKNGISVEQAHKDFIAQIPARRVGLPEEFGAACAFLASKWGGFITGQNIVLDGGLHHGSL